MNREPVGLVIVDWWIDLNPFALRSEKRHPRRRAGVKGLVLVG
jgi:hypothetical protein